MNRYLMDGYLMDGSCSETAVMAPRALQLAARVEKIDPPDVADICAAAALAVIDLLDDERSQPGGAWHDEVSAWNGDRIRKLMRRGRGAPWRSLGDVDGVTAQVGSAEVRAFVPGPMDDVPPALAKLQIQSSPLDVPVQVNTLPDADVPTLMIALTPAVEMSWGKQGAQAAHAGQRAWEAAADQVRHAWRDAGSPIEVVFATSTLWAALLQRGDVERIHDGGFTEIPAGTLTAHGWLHPAAE